MAGPGAGKVPRTAVADSAAWRHSPSSAARVPAPAAAPTSCRAGCSGSSGAQRSARTVARATPLDRLRDLLGGGGQQLAQPAAGEEEDLGEMASLADMATPAGTEDVFGPTVRRRGARAAPCRDGRVSAWQQHPGSSSAPATPPPKHTHIHTGCAAHRLHGRGGDPLPVHPARHGRRHGGGHPRLEEHDGRLAAGGARGRRRGLRAGAAARPPLAPYPGCSCRCLVAGRALYTFLGGGAAAAVASCMAAAGKV